MLKGPLKCLVHKNELLFTQTDCIKSITMKNNHTKTKPLSKNAINVHLNGKAIETYIFPVKYTADRKANIKSFAIEHELRRYLTVISTISLTTTRKCTHTHTSRASFVLIRIASLAFLLARKCN